MYFWWTRFYWVEIIKYIVSKRKQCNCFYTKKNKRKQKLISSKIIVKEIKYNKKELKKINFNRFDSIHFLSGNPSPAYSKESIVFDIKKTNIISQELLEILKIQNFRGSIWFASSVAVYGNQKGVLNERTLCKPISMYGISKLFLEKSALLYGIKYKLNIGIYRIFSSYGYGLQRQLIYDAITKIYKSNNKTINFFGTGLEKRDLSYVDDVVKGIIILNKQLPNSAVYNIGSGKSYSVKFIITLLMKIMNKKLNIKFSSQLREYDGKNWKASISKIKKLGYKPSYPIEKGLKKTVKDFFEHI